MPINASTILETGFGAFRVDHHDIAGNEVVSFTKGNIKVGIPLVRLHSACLFGEAFHSLECDCRRQLTDAMRLIADRAHGVIVYSYRQEGRGIGLKKKIRAMEIQRITGCDTVQAFKELGFDDPDQRDYRAEVEALKELGASEKIHLMTSNPNKYRALSDAGFNIVNVLLAPDT